MKKPSRQTVKTITGNTLICIAVILCGSSTVIAIEVFKLTDNGIAKVLLALWLFVGGCCGLLMMLTLCLAIYAAPVLIAQGVSKAWDWLWDPKYKSGNECRTWLGKLVQDAMQDVEQWEHYEGSNGIASKLKNERKDLCLTELSGWRLQDTLDRELPRHDRKIISNTAKRLFGHCVENKRQKILNDAIKKIVEPEKSVDKAPRFTCGGVKAPKGIDA